MNSEPNQIDTPDEPLAPETEAPQTPLKPVSAGDNDAERQMRRMSRRSFLWGALAVGSGYGGLRWLNSRRLDDGIVWPLRRVLQTNEEIGRDFFNASRLAPTFSASRIEPIRTNGLFGLSEDFDVAQWELTVEGLADENESIKQIKLAQIKALPRVEMITELKCIEGWAVVNRWVGARLSDFMTKYPPATLDGELPAYVGLATPDGGYYVGLEMEAAQHPQTLLCYEMNGKPLAPENGAPLRLAIPVKYGIKNIKRIGTLTYTNQRPPDYWHQQGYDYYAGH